MHVDRQHWMELGLYLVDTHRDKMPILHIPYHLQKGRPRIALRLHLT